MEEVGDVGAGVALPFGKQCLYLFDMGAAWTFLQQWFRTVDTEAQRQHGCFTRSCEVSDRSDTELL